MELVDTPSENEAICFYTNFMNFNYNLLVSSKKNYNMIVN